MSTPPARRAFGRDRHHERDGEAERVRAGDDENGDGADDGFVGKADESPHDRRDDAGAEREPEQPSGRAVGDALRTRGRVLRLGDEPLDAGERGVVAHRGDLDANPESVATVPATTASPSSRVERCCDSPVIIDSSMLAAPDTTRPSAGTRPPGRTTTTSPTRRSAGATVTDAIALDAFGLIGQQRRERVQCRRGLRERAHLDPVTEQHDHDQQRELPPEVELVVEEAEARARGRRRTRP